MCQTTESPIYYPVIMKKRAAWCTCAEKHVDVLGSVRRLGIARLIVKHSRVQAMHTTFDLRAGSTELETRPASLNRFTKLGNVAHTDVLERVLETNVEVGEERVDGALVLHVAGDTLGDLDGR